MIWVTQIRARELKPPRAAADKLTDRICQAVGTFDHRKGDVLFKIDKIGWEEIEHI